VQRPANTELFKQWIEQWKPLAYRGMKGVVELFGPSAASSGTKSCFGKSAGRAPRLLGSVWA
jgi:hypothetical protein